ncbi:MULTISPECIES: threonine ammonia-lyase [Eubacteriales]|uniref:threonine ammonia-lyase n=1 Tax=Eubacteriales TaxID=186802 RepID=UPI0008217197|nr:threonine/serine dehydratase [Muriventricola aceti]MCU6701746.1 threonine/serine dehydratase [Muriventricola aceti]SCI74309.1 L-threonine dehydratase catabolic TdcB [uncultured Flavonifractor sp.]
MISLQDVQAAQSRIAPYITRTPLLRVPALDEALGCEVYLKFEGFQVMGAFKLRGAMNKALSLTQEELDRGIVCASSGNHAQGVACAAHRLGARAVIVMPTNANPVKLAGVKAFGGQVELVGTLGSQREGRAAQLVEQEGMVNVHPYADPYVAAGQGTIGLEIIEDQPALDAVAVPIGGGGLISGVATAVKGLAPQVKTIGVEPAGADRYARSRAAGQPVTLDKVDTIADGTRTDHATLFNFEMIQDKVDELCTADDDHIRQAMVLLMTKAKLMVEPSGALPVAAALAGRLPVEKGQKVAFVLSGGNVDPALAAQLLADVQA